MDFESIARFTSNVDPVDTVLTMLRATACIMQEDFSVTEGTPWRGPWETPEGQPSYEAEALIVARWMREKVGRMPVRFRVGDRTFWSIAEAEDYARPDAPVILENGLTGEVL